MVPYRCWRSWAFTCSLLQSISIVLAEARSTATLGIRMLSSFSLLCHFRGKKTQLRGRTGMRFMVWVSIRTVDVPKPLLWRGWGDPGGTRDL